MPSYRKEEFPSEECPGKDEIRELLKDNTMELEIEDWDDGQYESAEEETFWPGNLARRLREQMEEQNIGTIDFSPDAFTRRFNARVAEFTAKVEAGKKNR